MFLKYKKICLFSLILCLQGCIIAPGPIDSSTINIDSSTPVQYNSRNAGLLGFYTNSGVESVIITKNGRNAYNLLVDKYKVKLKTEKAIDLNMDDGIVGYTDVFGNQLYLMDLQHLAVFLTLSAWLRSGL